MIVADANIILYALMTGERTAAAREALERADGVAVPPVWRLEVANALAVIVRRGLLSREQAEELFSGALAAFSSREHTTAPDAALRTALVSTLSSYDAEYVSLARALKCSLVTNDARILREAPDVALPLVHASEAASGDPHLPT